MTEVERLWRDRPRSRFLRWSVAVLAAIATYAWIFGDLRAADSFAPERVGRFVREVLPPAPDWGRGLAGMGATLAMAVLAICLAGLGGLALTLPGARTFATPEAYLPHGDEPSRARRLSWGAVVYGTRALQLFLRAIPEYVWAYLFVAMLGPTAWPAVLALAVHNAGILGKLGSETVENLEPATLRSLRAMGASRAQVAVAGIWPASLGRFLLYFVYRFETCVRDATVLGMLGIVSLGYWIADARAKRFYDEMLFYVLLAAAIVLAADVGSAWARRAVRSAP